MTEPPEPDPRGLRRWLDRLHGRVPTRQIGFVAGLLTAAAVAFFLWISGNDPDSSPTAAPKKGLACPQLREAFEQSEAGNEDAVRRSVRAAARAGERALDRSGQAFGRPEEIALELEYVLAEGGDRASRDVARFMDEAEMACKRLGRWSGEGAAN